MFDRSRTFIELYIEDKRFVFWREKITVILTFRRAKEMEDIGNYEGAYDTAVNANFFVVLVII